MVEISNARYEELIAAETTLYIVKRVCASIPSYRMDEALKALLDTESEVKPDAE